MGIKIKYNDEKGLPVAEGAYLHIHAINYEFFNEYSGYIETYIYRDQEYRDANGHWYAEKNFTQFKLDDHTLDPKLSLNDNVYKAAYAHIKAGLGDDFVEDLV